MLNLNFRSATDFEDFCCYWMTEIIKKKTGERVRFVRFGSSGQAQSGVDIISSPINRLPVVAQCKCYSRRFTLTDLKAELKKTDNYPNPISRYFLLTTATPHSSIQNAMSAGYLTHTRQNGTSFKVYIYHWCHLENIDFLPQSAWRKFFPEVQFTPVINQDPNAMEKQFALLKQLLEEKLPVAHLDWLEEWDFSSGYMNSTDFEPFRELVYDYYLVKSSFDHKDHTFIDTPLRLKIYQCLPAGNGFFQALATFSDSVSSQIIGASINGKESLSVLDLSDTNRHKITRQWISNAEYLAKKYRDIAF
ncbi:hypothetical protein ACVQ8M_17765 (plasmid) [Edwardsiella tarda]|uniref:hypothetical protein n=1 Tax=Vibrio parahaemolyticus TaxID=670 RepID=UPI00387A8B9B